MLSTTSKGRLWSGKKVSYTPAHRCVPKIVRATAVVESPNEKRYSELYLLHWRSGRIFDETKTQGELISTVREDVDMLDKVSKDAVWCTSHATKDGQHLLVATDNAKLAKKYAMLKVSAENSTYTFEDGSTVTIPLSRNEATALAAATALPAKKEKKSKIEKDRKQRQEEKDDSDDSDDETVDGKEETVTKAEKKAKKEEEKERKKEEKKSKKNRKLADVVKGMVNGSSGQGSDTELVKNVESKKPDAGSDEDSDSDSDKEPVAVGSDMTALDIQACGDKGTESEDSSDEEDVSGSSDDDLNVVVKGVQGSETKIIEMDASSDEDCKSDDSSDEECQDESDSSDEEVTNSTVALAAAGDHEKVKGKKADKQNEEDSNSSDEELTPNKSTKAV